MVLQFFGKVFQKIVFKGKVLKKYFQWLSYKNMPISHNEGCFWNPEYGFLEEAILFWLALKWNI